MRRGNFLIVSADLEFWIDSLQTRFEFGGIFYVLVKNDGTAAD